MLLRRVLRRRLVRVSVGTGVPRRLLRGGGGVIEGAQKVLRRQKHAEYDPLCVHPIEAENGPQKSAPNAGHQ